MMENFEKCLKIRARLKELSAKAVRFGTDIQKEERGRDLLSQAQMSGPEKKAAIDAMLSGQDPSKLTIGLAEKKAKIDNLKKDLIDTQAGIDLLKEDLKAIELTAVSEVREKFMDSYLKTVKAFHRKLKEAEKFEAELWEIKQSAQDMASQACSFTRSPLPVFLRVLLPEVGEPSTNGLIRRFEKDCENQKIDLG